MKNNLLFTVLAFCSFFTMSAQFEKGDITLSPQLGVNFSTYWSTDVNYNARSSATFGLSGNYYFSDRWSLKSGLIYNGMGAKDGYDNIDKLNYLALPLNASWHFGKKRNWYLNFGPNLNFLLSAESEFSDGSKIGIQNSISSFDVGLGLGIGYTFNISESFIMFVDYQGYFGFINADKNGVLPYNIQNSKDGFNVGGIFKL